MADPQSASVTGLLVGPTCAPFTEMSSTSGEDNSFENQSFNEPRSRRVGITGPPSSFRLSTSTTDTSESASYSTPPSSPNPSSPPRPPRSPLRPTAPTRRASASLLKLETSDLSPDDDEMLLSHSRSFGSFSGLLNSQPSSIKSGRSVRPQTPDKPLPITPDPSTSASVHDNDRDHELQHEQEVHEDTLSQTASTSSSEPTSLLQSRATVSKRTHALEELLSTERAYASDLALIRDIHIPLASGASLGLNVHFSVSFCKNRPTCTVSGDTCNSSGVSTVVSHPVYVL